MKVEQLMAKVYDPRRLYAAWRRVKSNAGAAGVDQMSVEDFARREGELLKRIHDKLLSGKYRFQPAKTSINTKTRYKQDKETWHTGGNGQDSRLEYARSTRRHFRFRLH